MKSKSKFQVILLTLGLLCPWARGSDFSQRVQTCETIRDTPEIFTGLVFGTDNEGSYRVLVGDVYKGLAHDMVVVVPAPSSSIELGTTYLFYAATNSNIQSSAPNAGHSAPIFYLHEETKPLSEFAPEELALASVRRAGDGTVFGSILTQLGESLFEPVTHAKVVLTKGDRRHETHTDAQGLFEIDELPPGVYTMSASVRGDRITKSDKGQESFLIEARGCLQIHATVQSKTVISGTITLPPGFNSAGKKVSAIDRRGITIATTTDSDGRYRFTGLPLGEYKVGLNVQEGEITLDAPFAATYFPATNDVAQAKALRIRQGAQFSDINIFIPAAIKRMHVRVRVPLSNDENPRDLGLYFVDETQHSVEPSLVEDEGIFSFTLLPGMRYRLAARYNLKQPVTVGPEEYPEEIVAVPTNELYLPTRNYGYCCGLSPGVVLLPVTVSWPDGSPAEGITVLSNFLKGGVLGSAITDEHGNAGVPILLRGKFALSAYIDQQAACESTILLFDADKGKLWNKDDTTQDEAVTWSLPDCCDDIIPIPIVLERGECSASEYGQ